ncbi:MAG: hypothetical protein ACTSQE_02110 [Candidatus Heimdallarchaeaceae archaeon]
MTNLKEIVEKIEAATELSKEEIHKLINEKMREYGTLVTELGAAHIVARDLGINISSETTKNTVLPPKTTINQLVPDLNNISILGRITKIYGEITFQRKSDKNEGLLQSLIIEDKTGSIRVVCWDQKVSDLRDSNCKIGDPIRIIGAYTKQGRDGTCEVHVGNRGHIQIRPSDVNEDELPKINIVFTKIENIKGNEKDITIRGKITQIDDEILHFQRKDGTEGQKISCIIGDETGEVIVNCWNEKVNDVAKLQINDIVYFIGLSARTRSNGKIELHTSRMSNISLADKETDITVKKELIEADKIAFQEPLKIHEIKEVNKLVSTTGIITSITPHHEFQREDGTQGQVRNLFISDETGTIRVVLWDENAQYVKDDDLNKKIQIIGGYTRTNKDNRLEIHCGNQTQITLSEQVGDEIDPFNVDFTRIGEITDDMDEVHIIGTVINLEPIKEILTKSNETVNFRSFRIADKSGTIRVSCWRNNVKKLDNIQEQDSLKILNAKVKINENYPTELLITNKSIITKVTNPEESNFGFVSGATIAEMESTKTIIKDIEDLKEGETVTIQGTVMKLHDRPFIYKLCPDCMKKVDVESEGVYICPKHGTIKEPSNLLLFTFVLNDGTGNINVLCSGHLAEKILEMETNEVAKFVEEKESEKAPYVYLKSKSFEGSLLKISGKVRKNTYLDCLELKATEIKNTDYREVSKEIINTYHRN